MCLLYFLQHKINYCYASYALVCTLFKLISIISHLYSNKHLYCLYSMITLQLNFFLLFILASNHVKNRFFLNKDKFKHYALDRNT